jgi:hypothetical protein
MRKTVLRAAALLVLAGAALVSPLTTTSAGAFELSTDYPGVAVGRAR